MHFLFVDFILYYSSEGLVPKALKLVEVWYDYLWSDTNDDNKNVMQDKKKLLQK